MRLAIIYIYIYIYNCIETHQLSFLFSHSARDQQTNYAFSRAHDAISTDASDDRVSHDAPNKPIRPFHLFFQFFESYFSCKSIGLAENYVGHLHAVRSDLLLYLDQSRVNAVSNPLAEA